MMSLRELLEQGKTAVVDVETTLGDKKGKGPSPFDPTNAMIAFEVYDINKNSYGNRSYDKHGLVRQHHEPHFFSGIDYLVGHNIKFDILWLLVTGWLTLDELRDITLIDTSILEYKLSGNMDKWPSLGYCCNKYGIPTKTDKVKEFWDAGYDTNEIPKSILMEYLSNDCNITAGLCRKQAYFMEHDRSEKFQKRILLEMEALKSAIITEYEGMTVDYSMFSKHEKELEDKITLSNNSIEFIIAGKMPSIYSDANRNTELDVAHIDAWPDISSNEGVLKHLLYGGEVKIPVKVFYDGKPKYKTGKRKGEYKTKKAYITLGSDDLLPEQPLSMTTIQKCLDNGEIDTPELAKEMLAIAGHKKDYTTYFDGLRKHFSAYDEEDDEKARVTIHGNLNFTATATNRLSSSKPNLQNINGKDNE